MILRYHNTINDVIAFNRYHRENSPTVKRTVLICRVLGVPVVGVLSYMALIEEINEFPRLISLPVVLAAAYFILFGYG